MKIAPADILYAGVAQLSRVSAFVLRQKPTVVRKSEQGPDRLLDPV